MPAAVAAATVGLLCAHAAHAESDRAPPVVVVVESKDSGLDPDALRSAIERALGEPVVSLLDDAATRARGTLAIALGPHSRSARLRYRSAGGGERQARAQARGPTDDAQWLVDKAVSIVRSAGSRGGSRKVTVCDDVLDPWPGRGRASRSQFQLPTEVLDPFESVEQDGDEWPSSYYSLGPEVLDPWRSEPPARSSSRSTRRALGGRDAGTEDDRARNAASETAGALSNPRPDDARAR